MASHPLKKSKYGGVYGCEVIVARGNIRKPWQLHFWVALKQGYTLRPGIQRVVQVVVEKQPRIRRPRGAKMLASGGCEGIAARGEQRKT